MSRSTSRPSTIARPPVGGSMPARPQARMPCTEPHLHRRRSMAPVATSSPPGTACRSRRGRPRYNLQEEGGGGRTGEHADGGALAGAVVAEDRGDVAVVDLEVERVDGELGSAGRRVLPRERVRLDHDVPRRHACDGAAPRGGGGLGREQRRATEECPDGRPRHAAHLCIPAATTMRRMRRFDPWNHVIVVAQYTTTHRCRSDNACRSRCGGRNLWIRCSRRSACGSIRPATIVN